MSIEIGPYTAGERPVDVAITFTDNADEPLNLGAYTAAFVYKRDGADDDDATQITATITDAIGGVTQFTPPVASAAPGDYIGRVWVGNGGTYRYASERVVWHVDESLGSPPDI